MTRKTCFKRTLKTLRTGLIWLPLGAAMLAATGCADYKWRQDSQQAEQQAREQGKYLFVFYKGFLNNQSDRMHSDVLADPEVGALFNDTVNLLLMREQSPEHANYVAKYGVTSPPACVMVAPDGTYYVQSGFISKDRFIEFIKNAKSGKGTGGKPPAAAPARQTP